MSITRGLKNTLRNPVRSIAVVVILALSIGLVLTMLLARQAIMAKISSVKTNISSAITVSPAGIRGGEGGGEPLTADQIKTIKTTANVDSVALSLTDRLNSTDTNLQAAISAGSFGNRQNRSSTRPGGGSFTPPVTVTGTDSPTSLQSLGSSNTKITSGQTFDANSSANDAIVGINLASKNNLQVGSTFVAYNNTIAVIGIYDSGDNFGNSAVIMPLATLQDLTNQPGAVTSAIVRVNSVENIQTVTAALKASLGSSADVVSQLDSVDQIIAPLQNIQTLTLYSLIGSAVASVVILFFTILMLVRERRREIGVLKAIGASNSKIVVQFMSEALALVIIGAVIAVLLASFSATPITKMLAQNSQDTTAQTPVSPQTTGQGLAGGRFNRVARQSVSNIRDITATVNWKIWLYALLTTLIVAVVAGAIPAFIIAKIRPSEVMRSE